MEWEVVEQAIVSLKSFSVKGNWRLEVLSSENSESPPHQAENIAFVHESTSSIDQTIEKPQRAAQKV